MSLISDFDKSVPEGAPDPFALGLYDWVLSGWFNNETGELAAGFPVMAEDIVVDVGCGEGGAAGFCARRGAHVILIDSHAGKLERATERLADSPARKLEAYVSECDPVPLADRSVTRVICNEVLEHVDDPAVFVAELVRIGQPGALYLFTVPGTEQEKLQKHLAPATYFEKPNHVRIFEPEAFAAVVENAGLVIERRSSYGFFWSIWWMFYWQEEKSHGPAMDAWTRAWAEMLKGKEAAKIKQLLDTLLPKHQVLVARKPG